ncbi:MAG TPA: hypothetical protein VLL95_02495 [Phnomibacter sp.]|nr:hypothetical protein [Phnomibacter sp.]
MAGRLLILPQPSIGIQSNSVIDLARQPLSPTVSSLGGRRALSVSGDASGMAFSALYNCSQVQLGVAIDFPNRGPKKSLQRSSGRGASLNVCMSAESLLPSAGKRLGLA